MQERKNGKKIAELSSASYRKVVKRAKNDAEVIEKTAEVLFQSEEEFLHQLKNFSSVFLDTKTHSLEDMYLHQVEVPEARKLIGFDSHSSLLFLIFNKLIQETEETICLLQQIMVPSSGGQKISAKISIRKICKHIDQNISPIFRAAYLCWEWALQAVDFWEACESNFSARLPDFVEKFQQGERKHTNIFILQLLSSFYEDISKISDISQPITNQSMLTRFFWFESVLESIFTLPLVRALNYTHILKIWEASTPVEHADYLQISKALKSVSQIVRPLFKRIKEFYRLNEVAKELPDEMQPNFLKKYRIVLLDGIVTRKNKIRRIILCNDIFITVKLNEKEEPTEFSVTPVPLDMICRVSGNQCKALSSFGWILWEWESPEAKTWNAALLRSRRYVSTRTNFLFNRTGASIDSLLPIELVKLVEQLNASQDPEKPEEQVSIRQMMDKIVKQSSVGRISFANALRAAETKTVTVGDPKEIGKLLEKNKQVRSPNHSPREERIPGEWIFDHPTTYVCPENLIELINNEVGFDSLMKYCERSYCSEIPLFYQDVGRYVSVVGTLDAEPLAIMIAKQYILPDSPHEVNIEHQTKSDLLSNVDKKLFTEDLFNESRDQALLLMLEDTFPSYIDSQEFCEYYKQVENILLEKERKKKRKERSRFHRLSSFIMEPSAKKSPASAKHRMAAKAKSTSTHPGTIPQSGKEN